MSEARETRLPVAWIVGILAAAGVGLRVWILLDPVGALDSDEAIVGLMARHMLDGEFSLFFWGQPYGGSQEVALTALVFSIAGPSTLAVKLVPLGLNVAACILVWRVGLRTVGSPAAELAGALSWVWPAAFVWWSVKATGFYELALVLAAATLLLVLRLRERDSLRDAAWLGLVLGLACWATPQFAVVAVPALVWLLVARPSVIRTAWAAAATGLVGVFPWLGHNLLHGWVSVRPPAIFRTGNGYLDHLGEFFTVGLPGALGVRVPDGVHWVPPVAGQVLYVAALGAFAVALFRTRAVHSLLAAVAIAYPFLLSLSTYAWFMEHPKYLLFLSPVLALLVARAAVSLPPAASLGVLEGAAALTAAAVLVMSRGAYVDPGAAGVPPSSNAPAPSDAHVVQMRDDDWLAYRVIPADFGPVLDYLAERGIEHVYADYWLAYRIAFESDEEVIATPYRGNLRQGAFDAVVRAAERPAYVFVRGTRTDPLFRELLTAQGVTFVRTEVGAFVVYEPDRNVTPEQVPAIKTAAQRAGSVWAGLSPAGSGGGEVAT